jgi:hypothetical protein
VDEAKAPGSWFENVALRHNGDLLVTMLAPYASIYSIQKPLSASPSVSVINIPNANGTLGIAETSPDVFAIVAGSFSSLAMPVPGTQTMWELDMSGPQPKTRLIASMPDAGLLNGVAKLPHLSAILVADSGLGKVWRVDIKTGKYVLAAEVPEMAAVPMHAAPQLGVNGVRITGDGFMYFSNSNRAAIYRLRIDRNGFAVKGAKAECVAQFDADNIDDFAIDGNGEYWAATNFDNTLVVAKMGLTTGDEVVVGRPTDLTVAGDTSLALGGRTWADRNLVYVVTAGALGRPVNGTVTEPAKVVVIDRSGFQ